MIKSKAGGISNVAKGGINGCQIGIKCIGTLNMTKVSLERPTWVCSLAFFPTAAVFGGGDVSGASVGGDSWLTFTMGQGNHGEQGHNQMEEM